MPYRDVTPRHAASLPPHPLWEKLHLWGFVVLAPWIVPAIVVKDAHEHLRLASLPAPLGEVARAQLLERLEREAPVRVTRFVTIVHTMASGDEEVWNVVAVRFRQGPEHVVASFVGPPSTDHGARVLATVRRHRELRAVVDEEICLGLPGIAIFFSLLPAGLWALALALLVAPLASLLVIAPLPIAMLLHAIARRAARHVLDAELTPS